MTPWIRRMCLLAPVMALAMLAAVPSVVSAHAELVRAIPDQGATVTDPVSVVTGRYSEDMTGNSHLDVKDASGATVASGGIDPDDARRLIARPASPLTPGTFTVDLGAGRRPRSDDMELHGRGSGAGLVPASQLARRIQRPIGERNDVDDPLHITRCHSDAVAVRRYGSTHLG